LAAALKKEPDPPVVMLAGAGLECEDIDESINIKSDVLAVLDRLATKVGGAS